MKRKTYSEKLADPRWQKKRLEVLERCEWSCLNCGDSSNQLQVHHLVYERGVEPWDHDNQYLIAVCKNCHEELDDTRSRILKMMAHYPPEFLRDLHDALCNVLEPVHNGTHPYERWTRWMDAANKIRKAKK